MARRKSIIFKAISMLIIITMLSACGGGGGSKDSPSSGDPVIGLLCLFFLPICLSKSGPPLEPDQALMNSLSAIQTEKVSGKISFAPAASSPGAADTTTAYIVVLAKAPDRRGGTYATGYIVDDRYENGIARMDRDAILIKYDIDGKSVWAHRFGSLDDEYGQDVVAADDGSVVVSVVRNANHVMEPDAIRNEMIYIALNGSGVIFDIWSSEQNTSDAMER